MNSILSAVGVLFVLVLACDPGIASELIVKDAVVDASERTKASVGRFSHNTIRSRFVHIDVGALAGNRLQISRNPLTPRARDRVQPVLVGGSFDLTLFDDKRVSIEIRRIEDHSNGARSFWGSIVGDESGLAQFSVSGESLHARIQTGGQDYSIAPVRNNVHRVRQFDGASQEPCVSDEIDAKASELHGSTKPLLKPVNASTPAEVAQNKSSAVSCGWPSNQLGILVVYTPDFTDAVGAGNVDTFIASMISLMGSALSNANITTSLHLAHSYEINYAESSSWATNVTRLEDDDDGHMDEVHEQRLAWGGDVVVLLVEDAGMGEGCGAAFTTASLSNPIKPFLVTSDACANDFFTASHEIGHILSARHPWANDSTDNAPFSYNHGYKIPLQTPIDTVMGGFTSGRINEFSDPDQNHEGLPQGLEDGTLDGNNNNIAADNAKAVRQLVCDVGDLISPDITVSTIQSGGVTVTNELCYGLNTVSWDPGSGPNGYYEVFTSAYSNYSQQQLVYSGVETEASVNVAGTRYVRARVCNAGGCGSYTNANTTATYYQGCQ